MTSKSFGNRKTDHSIGNTTISPFKIKTISAEQTIDLRHRVMWPDLPKDEVRVPGDSNALHFGAFHGQTLIGVGSFFLNGASARLRKLATDPAFQGQGVASTLLAAAAKHLTAQGCSELWCDARVSATGFYERNNFQIEQDVFQKRGFDYVIARRSL